MNIVSGLGLVLFGLAAGAITAAGFFAVVTAVGIVNRVAAVTKTTGSLILYEEVLVWGAVVGTVLSLFDIKLPGSIMSGVAEEWVQWIVMLGVALIGVVAGMYVGLFVVSLAETTKALPIFIRRVRIGAGLGLVILMIGLGKAVGELIYYFVLYD